MKTKLRCILLCSAFVLVNIFHCGARIVTSPVYVNSPDSSVHAHIVASEIKCKPKMGHAYYWYHMNSILSSDGGFSGRLLHGNYTSYFHNHNLKCQGVFDRGLKQGVWVTWFSNGKVLERTNYSDGVVDGARELYDSTGHLTMRIYYRNGVRAGKTKIFSQDGSDSVVRYKNGVVVTPKVKNDSNATPIKRQHKKIIKADSSASNSTDSIKERNTSKRAKAKSKPEKTKATGKHSMKTRIGYFFNRKDKKLVEHGDHE